MQRTIESNGVVYIVSTTKLYNAYVHGVHWYNRHGSLIGNDFRNEPIYIHSDLYILDMAQFLDIGWTWKHQNPQGQFFTDHIWHHDAWFNIRSPFCAKVLELWNTA